MKVLIVSGFLGSGKTTFIKEVSKKLNDMVILENDYAHANIDRDFLKESNKEILSLEEGCICCSKKKDFATKVMTIENTLNPEYLIIEPTGLGYLSKVIKNIKSIEYENIKILEPITIVDYNNIENNLKDYKELFIDQIKNSGLILLSKIENIEKEKVNDAIKKLKEFTNAEISDIHYKDFSASKWQSIFKDYDYNRFFEGDFKELDFDSLTYKNVEFKDFNQLGTYLNAIATNRFGKLLRAKGVAKVDGKYVKIDLVNDKFDIVKYENNSNINSLVFIGENLEKKSFDILFNEK